MATSMDDVCLDMAMSEIAFLDDTNESDEDFIFDMKLYGYPESVIEKEVLKRRYGANSKSYKEEDVELKPGSLF